MKRLTQIFQALLGVVALIFTAIIAFGRLTWRTIRKCWNRCSKWVRYSIATILAFGVVGFVALVGYCIYEDEYGRDYWDEQLSDTIVQHSFSDGTYRLYNEAEGVYTTPKFNWLSDVSDDCSLAVYALPYKRGYINVNTGRIVVDADSNDYQKAWVFSEGVAAVVRDDKIGFINADNEVVIPFQFDYSDECRMWDFGFVFHDGYCIMTDIDGDLGLIDKSGNWVVEAAYDEIWAPYDSGYRIIVRGDKYGVLDSMCSVVYPAEYDHIDILSDGFALTRDCKVWKVDYEGNSVRDFMYYDSHNLSYPIGYDEGGEMQYVLSDYAAYNVMGRYGILHRLTGEVITPALYESVEMLSKELFEVQDPESYDSFLLDSRGKPLKQ